MRHAARVHVHAYAALAAVYRPFRKSSHCLHTYTSMHDDNVTKALVRHFVRRPAGVIA